MMSKRKLLFKVVIVGDGGVGKSTMVQRLITGHYYPQRITIGTDLATHDIQINDSMHVKLQIWDFAGEQRFRIFLPNYARGAVVCLLCYDITRRLSFHSLHEWFNIVNDNAIKPVFILVGEKLDLADLRRSVEQKDAIQFKEEYNIDNFYETSSKSGENNRIIFEVLTRLILERRGLIE